MKTDIALVELTPTSPDDVTTSFHKMEGEDVGSFVPIQDKTETRRLSSNIANREEGYRIVRGDEDDDKSVIGDYDDDELDEDVRKRGEWDNKCDYMLSLVGYAVGFANVWRFPYMCYKNGGGAFLIPYFMMLVLGAIPLFLVEVAMGQFCSTGGITVFNICPALEGCGFAGILMNMLVYSYQSVIMTYPILFLYHSFSAEVPWGTCNNTWNTDDCHVVSSSNTTSFNETEHFVSSAEEFFHHKILEMSGGIGENGYFVWEIFGTSIFVWVVMFLCIFKGIRISGKLVWFTTTFPVVMLVILLIRGVTLPGAAEGLKYFLYPDFKKLADDKVWIAAAMQTLYSLGPGWATLFTVGSYNKFRNNCVTDTLVLPILNCAASILAGFVVFSVLGFMAHEMGTTVDKVTTAGTALVFITYPEALSKMPLASFWSVLFFLMLFFVAVDSFFVSFEACIANIMDRFRSTRNHRTLVTFVFLLLIFFMSLPYSWQGGMYNIQLIDWYATSLCMPLICLCQVIVFCYSYGVGRLIRDIQMMTQKRLSYYWFFTLLITAPIVVVLVLIKQVMSLVEGSYRDQELPAWAQIAGIVTALLPTVIIPIFIIVHLCSYKGSFKQRLLKGFLPTSTWGPGRAKFRAEWEEFCLRRPLQHKLLHPDLTVPSCLHH